MVLQVLLELQAPKVQRVQQVPLVQQGVQVHLVHQVKMAVHSFILRVPLQKYGQLIMVWECKRPQSQYMIAIIK